MPVAAQDLWAGLSLDDQGHGATNPWRMPFKAWISVAKRSWAETAVDNVGLIAAGVAFYGFLALVPLLGAIVLVYGLVAEPARVMRDMTQITAIMPADVARLVGEQLLNVIKTSDGKKGLGLLFALALALFGARNGAGAVITALNIAYEEEEKRGFFRVNLLALGITAAAVVVAMIALMAIAALGLLEHLIPGAPAIVIIAEKIAAYLLLTLAGAGAASSLYRYGPSRRKARWVWLTPGSLFAALMWLALTIGFGIYVANFGNYNATYGSLGAVVVTLTWLYLSSYILLFGAELNSELEHQTAQDTTESAAPLGDRGAWVADHVAVSEAVAKRPDAPIDDRSSSSIRADVATSSLAANAAALAGLPKIGWGPSVVATIGLSLLRRGRGMVGMALLGTAAAIAWRTRDRNRAIKAVFFDIDGTLVDSNDLHVAAWREAFCDRGFDVDPAAIRCQIGKGGDLLVPALITGASRDMTKQLSERHGDVFKHNYLDQVRPFAGAAALLRHAHGRGQRLVLASSADATEVEHYISLLGIADIVEATTSIDDVAISKPAGDIFEAALRKVKPLTPGDILIVGDTPYDVEAGAKCAISTVALRSGGFDDDALIEAGAIALYDGVADLLARYAGSPLGR